MSFSCPICSGPTEVAETRHNASGLRRARRCVSLDCSGRFTTQELPVRGSYKGFRGDFIAVPQSIIDHMVELAAELTATVEAQHISYGEETDGAW